MVMNIYLSINFFLIAIEIPFFTSWDEISSYFLVGVLRIFKFDKLVLIFFLSFIMLDFNHQKDHMFMQLWYVRFYCIVIFFMYTYPPTIFHQLKCYRISWYLFDSKSSSSNKTLLPFVAISIFTVKQSWR